MKRKNIIINTESFPNNIPVIRLKIDGLEGEYYAMIDTGSAITMFDRTTMGHIAKDSESTHKINVTGINGDASSDGRCIEVTAYAESSEGKKVKIGFGGVSYELSHISAYYHKEFGTELDFVAIIGSDVLHIINADVDYMNRQLIIKNEKEGANEQRSKAQ